MLNFNVPPVKNSTGEPVWKVRTFGTGTEEFYSVQKSSDLQILTNQAQMEVHDKLMIFYK